MERSSLTRFDTIGRERPVTRATSARDIRSPARRASMMRRRLMRRWDSSWSWRPADMVARSLPGAVKFFCQGLTNTRPLDRITRMTPSLATRSATDPTTAERRALTQLRTPAGQFAVIAADHGDRLVEVLDGLGLPSTPDAQPAVKLDRGDTAGRDASAVLLDPDVPLPAVVDHGVLARDVGLLVRIEADGADVADGLRRSRLIDGLGAAGARALGATAAKVMVFLRADREDLDGSTAELVRAALADCSEAGLLCVIELMTYRLEDEAPEAFAARKADL